MMMDMGQMQGWGMGALHLLFWLLVLAGVVLLILWLVDWIRPSLAEDSALEILKRRYAKGEIDRETYERMKKDIQ